MAGIAKRILFLTPQVPYPPEQGTAFRNYHLLAGAARRHKVSLLAFGSRANAPERALTDMCQEFVVIAPPDRRMRDRLRTLLTSRDADMSHRLRSSAFGQRLLEMLSGSHYDVLQVEGIELAQYGLMAREWLGRDAPRIVFDDHNAEAELQRRAAIADLASPRRWPAGAYSLVQAARLKRLERRACQVADAVVAVSTADADYLEGLCAGREVAVIPNGVDTGIYRPDLGDTLHLAHPAVVYTGKMDYRPNVDAVLWFHSQVWPRIVATVEGARFYVVGKDPHPRLAPLDRDPSVTVTGYVPEVLPYFGGADVYVAPLRVGGGTRLKILQALAAGLPLVTTTLGAEGIDLADREQALFADTAQAFASAVIGLLQDPETARALGQAGRARVVKSYDWDSIIPWLEGVYAGL